MNKLYRLKIIKDFENIRNDIKDKLTLKQINKEIAEVRSQKVESKRGKDE